MIIQIAMRFMNNIILHNTRYKIYENRLMKTITVDTK